jgi:hypothetical protein
MSELLCAWCDQPAVTTIVVEPAQYRMTRVGGILAPVVARFAIQANVCARHAEVRDREGGTFVRDARRVKAVGTVQLDIFGNETRPGDPRAKRHERPTNAIKGGGLDAP